MPCHDLIQRSPKGGPVQFSPQLETVQVLIRLLPPSICAKNHNRSCANDKGKSLLHSTFGIAAVADNWPSARALARASHRARNCGIIHRLALRGVMSQREKYIGPFRSGTWRYSAGPPNTLQPSCRTLQVSRCIDLAQLEDVETLAQPNRRLLRGMRYRTIYYFLREKSAWGAWLTILFRFRHVPCLPRPGFRGPEHNEH